MLYVVATPIGNLQDISPRALDALRNADVVAAEDTRHTRGLLSHFGISASMVALHEHNEDQQTEVLLQKMQEGQVVALVSDAGTPLVSDPGYRLVSRCHDVGIPVSPIPGASSVMAALSVCGLPTDRFLFEGFLPAKSAARKARLQVLAENSVTLILLESNHRIVAALADMVDVLGAEREVVLARELTKAFETVKRLPLGEMLAWVSSDENQQRGELVLLVRGKDVVPDADVVDPYAAALVKSLVAHGVAAKVAAKVVADVTSCSKNAAYEWVQALKDGVEG